MIHRDVTARIKQMIPSWPVVCIMGPRQAGKTTFARDCFPAYTYYLCDFKELRLQIEKDPHQFLATAFASAPGIIIDEFQRCPDLLDAIKIYVDETKSQGQIVLTGSQNYLMMSNITQSLAGRVMLVDFLPLAINELQQAQLLPQNIYDLIYKGSFPRIYSDPTATVYLTYENYIRTYIERDVQTLPNPPDLYQFDKFLRLCAGRIGQQLNMQALAADAGIDFKTANQWVSLLISCYVVYLLPPHFANFNKTVTKHAKLYFSDTGIACWLLNIKSPEDLAQHPMRGALFENFVITECKKWHYARTSSSRDMYFSRDNQGNEVDLIFDQGMTKMTPVEIKAAGEAKRSMTEGLAVWRELAGDVAKESFVIYTGTEMQSIADVQFFPWQHIPDLLSKLYPAQQ
ncbi:ATP-binding protein [Candidatus Dependentiae bacterium]|nr:ATP-binding protein [Candidatus Dependentiae bacterium]